MAQQTIQLQANELTSVRQQLSQIEQHRLQIQTELEQTKKQSEHLREQLIEKDQAKQNVDLLIDQYRQQSNNEKQLRLSSFNNLFVSLRVKHLHSSVHLDKENELEAVRSKLSQLSIEYDQLMTSKREFESNEAKQRHQLEETARSRQAVLDRTREEYEKLLQKYHDLDEIYRVLVDKRDEEICKRSFHGIEIEFFFFSLVDWCV